MTSRRIGNEAGSSLIEVTVATGLLLVVMVGLLGMSSVATRMTENEGHLGARTTEYAQDKMEQLLALAFTDAVSDTRVFPTASSGGTGLAVGGSSAAASPAASYVDWLDESGNLLSSTGTAAPTGWFYERVWAISTPSTNLKQITVTVTVARSAGGAQAPSSTLVALKTSPF